MTKNNRPFRRLLPPGAAKATAAPPIRRPARATAMAAALFFLAFLPRPAAAVAGEAAPALERPGETSRRVLILFNSREAENKNTADTRSFEYLVKPLNHMGFAEEYADVNQPLPDFRPYRAVMVWLASYEMERPREFLPWIQDAIRSGKRMIFPDGLQAPMTVSGEEVDAQLLPGILREFGLEPAPYDLGNELDKVRLNALAPDKFSFETDVFDNRVLFPVLRAAKPGLTEWLRLERTDDPERYGCGLAVGDPGAWCLGERLLYYSLDIPGQSYRAAWHIDPFAFLEAALDCADMPKPDITTYWGARGAYCHVDVDGPSNMSQDYPGESRMAFDLVLTEVLEKYPLPTTLGLISAEYDPTIDIRLVSHGLTAEENLAKPRQPWERPQAELAMDLRAIASRAFALPHIQAGCHGYTHPLDWRGLGMAFDVRGYTPSYEQEVRGGIEYLNQNVLPPDKPVELYHWTGDCDPPEEPLAILGEMGIANINGGDPRYDGMFSSVYYICPLSVKKGRYRQIHTSGSNENIYTDGWTGFKGSFNNVIATFERSDAPRRLLPVNIYYHTFPAERVAGLRAIQHAYEWAAKQELCWMRAVEYVRAAEDFFKARIGETEDGGWWAEDYGACRTLRFDAEERNVDMARSRNLAGYFHHNGSLYVALLPGERAEVRLGNGSLEVPCLARSSGMLEDVEAGKGFWRARARIWGYGFVELWAPEGNWRAGWTTPDGKGDTVAAVRLADGRVRIRIPDPKGQWVKVHFEN